MPDSPRCHNCLKKGVLGQTYRIAGQQKFKCSTCKQIFDKSSFDPIDFVWKDDPDAWKSWVTSKGIKLEAVNK